MRVVTARVEEEVFDGLEYLKKVRHTDQAELVRKLLDKAVKAEKLQVALESLRDHKITYHKAAEIAGVPYVDLFAAADEAGIDFGMTASDVEESFEKVVKQRRR